MSHESVSSTPASAQANEADAVSPADGLKPQAANASKFWHHLSLEELAAEQGVKPVENPDELLGDFWPEEENLDDFLAWFRKLRREGKETD